MNIYDNTLATSFTIQDVIGLDPIRVYIENYEPGKGRITIQCWDLAWACYWGAMSGQTVEQFFVRASPDYLAGCLRGGDFFSLRVSVQKGRYQYLKRIIETVQAALRLRADPVREDAVARTDGEDWASVLYQHP